MLFDLQHIVCAVDLSSHSEGVVHAGGLLARAFNARLSVFHAVTASHDHYPGTAIFERGGEQDELMKTSRQKLKELVAPLKPAGTIIATGDPVERLSDWLQGTAGGLVVAARHGSKGPRPMLLGGVVERMVRQLALPVLVTRRTRKNNREGPLCNKVVAACQAAANGSPVLMAAAAVARQFDAELNLLHAMELPVRPELMEPTDGPYGDVQTTLQDRLRQELVAAARSTAGDLNVSIDLAEGPAAEVLAGHTARQKADLLVVGVRPRRRLAQFLIGSTTEAALRSTSCAVLTVPTKA
ncbi:MAG: universal stress protein [Desulfobacterales bacterium]|nr:universal stress protein [Desulfobacterales bacterium]MDJ0854352.1 universal stress protein [Desulfobacterales bacterium]MDJ0886112.1 universal stress protein [Desulfobacterales bacterium]